MILWVVLYLVFGACAAVIWAAYEAEHMNERDSYIDHYNYTLQGDIPSAEDAENQAEKHEKYWHFIKPFIVALIPLMGFMITLIDPVPMGKHLVLLCVFAGAFWIVFNPVVALFTGESPRYLSNKGVDGVLAWLRDNGDLPAWFWQVVITLQLIFIVELFV